MQKKNIYIVTPTFNEELNIIPFIIEIQNTFKKLKKYNYTILFVDDGSVDNTIKNILDYQLKNKNIKLLELSRNFGKEIALTAGLQSISNKANAAILIDVDLQHPPSLIPELIKKWEEGFDIVNTFRSKNEKQSLIKKITSKLFYKILNLISEKKIIPNLTDFKLLDIKVILEFKKFTEHNRMFRGLIDWMGFKVTYISFEAAPRLFGKANYSFKQLLRLAINSLISFSLFPLKLTFYIGIFIVLGFGSLLIYMLFGKFIFNIYFTPLAYISVINASFTGLTLICLGLMAYYIANIHIEVTNRPLFIVRKFWDK